MPKEKNENLNRMLSCDPIVYVDGNEKGFAKLCNYIDVEGKRVKDVIKDRTPVVEGVNFDKATVDKFESDFLTGSELKLFEENLFHADKSFYHVYYDGYVVSFFSVKGVYYFCYDFGENPFNQWEHAFFEIGDEKEARKWSDLFENEDESQGSFGENLSLFIENDKKLFFRIQQDEPFKSVFYTGNLAKITMNTTLKEYGVELYNID